MSDRRIVAVSARFELGRAEPTYLEQMITWEGIKPRKDKVRAIPTCEILSSVKGRKAFK